jgi:hypothetical protein
MSRFLFVVPPLTGHVNPTVSVGRELVERGHDVAWAGHPAVLRPLLGGDDQVVGVAEEETEHLLAAVAEPSRGLRGVAALKFLWHDFLVPLADAMVPALDQSCGRFDPEVLVVDQQALAGAVVARREGLHWATTATTSAELVDPLGDLPKVAGWVRGLLAGLAARHDVTWGGDLRFSDELVLGFTTEALVGPIDQFPPHYVLTGPSIDRRPRGVDFPWEWLDGRPAVLVSLGTLNAGEGERFFQAAIDAIGKREVQGIVVADPRRFDQSPSNVLIRPRVPQIELLARIDAVVSHAGHNTVCETLAHGLPLVLAPIRDDQPVVAQQVVTAGAGIRVKFGRVTGDALGSAIDRVLVDGRYTRAARSVRDSFTAAGGSATAADHLEKLT